MYEYVKRQGVLHMEPGNRFSEMKYAVNTRMFLMIAGMILIFNALTSTIPSGMRLTAMARLVSEYEEGTPAEEEGVDVGALKEDMEKLGITVSDLRLVGRMNMVMAVVRMAAGILCLVFCNRVDKSRMILVCAIALAACEVIFAVFMYFNRFLGIGTLFYSALLTGILLFGAIRMRKIAREDPDRKLLLQPAQRRTAGARPEAPKKSIKERAMMGSASDDQD